MKISNRTKDMMLIIGFLLVLFWVLLGATYWVASIFAEDRPFIEEYQNRQTIIRAETDEDRFYNEMWRRQYQEQYGVEWEE